MKREQKFYKQTYQGFLWQQSKILLQGILKVLDLILRSARQAST
jgi:hypothetical protein